MRHLPLLHLRTLLLLPHLRHLTLRLRPHLGLLTLDLLRCLPLNLLLAASAPVSAATLSAPALTLRGKFAGPAHRKHQQKRKKCK